MPQRFGRFWVHDKIGQGGMAEIYRATIGPNPTTYGFDLALKRLHDRLAHDPEQVDMFFTEADIAKFLRHPNLIQVYEAGVLDGHAYIAMEYVWGFDLAALLERLQRRQMRIPPDLAVYIAMQVLRALDYVHRATTPGGEAMSLVHRDVTPANIYVSFRGEVKFGDFGVARVSFLEGSDNPGLLKGKVAYMPPEVLLGEPVDQGVDLWSLSVTMYELLTGGRFYNENVTEEQMIVGDVTPEVAPLHKMNSEVDSKLSALLLRFLDPKPRRRPGSAVEMYRQLKVYAQQAGMDVAPESLARFTRGLTDVGPAMVEPHTQPTSDAFSSPGYQAPIDLTPTQQFLRIRRKKNHWRAAAAVSGLVVLFVVALVMRKFRSDDPPPLVPVIAVPVIAPPQAQPTNPIAPAVVAAPSVQTVPSQPAVVPQAAPTPAKMRRYRNWVQRGNTHLRRGRSLQATQAFARSIEALPTGTDGRAGLARGLVGLGRYAEAQQHIDAVLRLDPKHAVAFLALGELHLNQGALEAARRALRQCLSLASAGKTAQAARKLLEEL